MVKLHITPQELQTLRQTEIFHVKRHFLERLSASMASFQEEAREQACWQEIVLPMDFDKSSGKISKGENYHGLPWMMADLPRHFGKQDVFAFRLFFWWGQYFSATWHLKGAPLQTWWPSIRQWIVAHPTNLWLSMSGDEWDHRMEAPTYLPASTAILPAASAPPPWLKLTQKMELESDWYEAGMKHFTSFLQAVY